MPQVEATTCQQCNGHGMIGGFVGSIGSGGEGYDSETCPTCNGSGRSASSKTSADPQNAQEVAHPRGSMWCAVSRCGAEEGDPTWCWCRYEIVGGIGQCPECQEDADDEWL